MEFDVKYANSLDAQIYLLNRIGTKCVVYIIFRRKIIMSDSTLIDDSDLSDVIIVQAPAKKKNHFRLGGDASRNVS